MNYLIEIIHKCLSLNLNVMLTGYHGVGKTFIVLDAARKFGLRFKYFSSTTLDPWADLVGIPIPVEIGNQPNSKKLHFIRPDDVDIAEILFFDELNRAHSKIHNAVLEAIQFRTINGVPLPRLKMVWAAINPPNDIYTVNELDPVIMDRFHVFLEVPAQPSLAYYVDQAQIPVNVARALVEWWNEDLDDNLRRVISPRRLEYMGRNFVSGIDFKDSIPTTIKVPLKHLAKRVEESHGLPFDLTRLVLIHHQSQIIAMMEQNNNFMVAVADRLEQWSDIMPKCIDIFLHLQPEFQAKLLSNPDTKSALVNLARQGNLGNRALQPLADRLTAMGVRIGSKSR